MKFPNLAWAMRQRRLAGYEVGQVVGKRASAFSRAGNGLVEFTSEERAKIAVLLGFPEPWLFQEIVPPRVDCETERLGVLA